MAFLSNRIKALASGSGKAPSIFTYNGSVDLLAEITTEGYFDADGGSAIFEVNDILYVKYNDGISFSKIICVQNDTDADIGAKLDFSVMSSFAGDVRATDVVGYQSDNFGVGIGSAQGVFMQYTYRNNTDTLAIIAGADYFIDAGTFLEIGDVIEVVGVNGHQMLMVTASGASNVTTRVITFL